MGESKDHGASWAIKMEEKGAKNKYADIIGHFLKELSTSG